MSTPELNSVTRSIWITVKQRVLTSEGFIRSLSLMFVFDFFAHRREEVRVHGVLQEVHAERPPGQAHKDSPE